MLPVLADLAVCFPASWHCRCALCGAIHTPPSPQPSHDSFPPLPPALPAGMHRGVPAIQPHPTHQDPPHPPPRQGHACGWVAFWWCFRVLPLLPNMEWQQTVVLVVVLLALLAVGLGLGSLWR